MDSILELILGDNLTPQMRIWSTLMPAILVTAYFILGTGVYAIRFAIKGHSSDAEIEKRPSTVLTGMWARLCFVWLMQPLWKLILRTGIPANAVTTLSVLLAAGSGVATAAGRFGLGGWLYIFSGILDYVDGRLARARGEQSRGGAALDSILDRYSDSAVLMGLAWYYRDSWVLVAVLVALVGSSLVPYVRAKGEVVGVNMTFGLMQRAERILYLGVAVALSPILEAMLAPTDEHPVHRLAVVGLVLLAVSSQLTALQRLVYLINALGDGGEPSWFQKGLGSKAFPRTIIAALVATGADFALAAQLVREDYVSAPTATALGCAMGAVINFTMNRAWAFKSDGKALPQMSRYGFVSFTSALLNAGGVAVMMLLPAMRFSVAWMLVRAAVFVTWNFPLQRDYVFGAEEKTVEVS